MKPLYVVTSLFNPVRFNTRIKHYEEFADHLKKANVKLITVEVAFGKRPHELTWANEPTHVQLRSSDEIWHKETAINIGVQRLCQIDPDWEYVSWVDADVHFSRTDWAEETVHQLQHYQVLQPWSQALDTGPDGTVTKNMTSFGYAHVHGLQDPSLGKSLNYYKPSPTIKLPTEKTPGWHHPGLAWAYRREAWDAVGGMYDLSIVGHADTIMALAMIGHADKSGMDGCTVPMLNTIVQWQNRATRLHRNIGYVDGSLIHRFHGPKSERQYGIRRKILTECKFNPHTHLTRDSQGLLCLDDNAIELRDRLRQYFRARNEDGQ